MGESIFDVLMNHDWTQFFLLSGIKLSLVLLVAVVLGVAIKIDQVLGIRKAKERGEGITSHGRRKTIRKANEYFVYLLFAVLFDTILTVAPVLINMALSSTSDITLNVKILELIPITTFIVGFCLVRIEYRSWKEKASDKIRKAIPDVDPRKLVLFLLSNSDFKDMIVDELKKESNDNNSGTT